jgi:hypothetical protein
MNLHKMKPGLARLSFIGLVIALAGCSDSSDNTSAKTPESTAPLAAVSGPITAGSRGFPATPAVVDLDAAGYIEEEFFLEGTARAYEQAGEWAIDGQWSVKEVSMAEYKTRMLVRRPVDPDQFSGVVIVEWFNVTSNVDIDPDFGFLSTEILREGHAWVGVTAQAIAIDSVGAGPFGPGAVGLAIWDPVRYDSLSHPGDAYSYDIFSQAGAAIRADGGTGPLQGLRPRWILATGQSQSAVRMLTYANAIHPDARVYDAFLIHSRPGVGAPLGDGFTNLVGKVRSDLDSPVFQVITETELFELAGVEFSFTAVRQPDSATVHTWELAGMAHADADYLTALTAQGNKQYEDFLDLSAVIPLVNSAPQNLAMNAALHYLVKWVVEGIPPASAPPITTSDDEILRDANGNALGGLRLPHIEVPTAVLTGEDGIPFSGSTIPFDTPTLEALYPNPETYINSVRASAQSAVDAGYLLAVDAESIVAEAENNPPVD